LAEWSAAVLRSYIFVVTPKRAGGILSGAGGVSTLHLFGKLDAFDLREFL
jgi:hypothetical protein